ncbi:hypothetical protein C8A03DRAFT_33945 [Achaetomium macrosporum]|uniref:Uncharacterized protein n=1 Tax=Achaetomium macrosporum TaxID=79813 RepID=A0AAN7CA92_9PEZI|nr:hypothetical protein C8A03DRAFT_33945 [Achaetomium macrosporum]
MEDEEYYHMMLEDMERLTRVHHHYPSLPNTRDPSPTRQQPHQQQPQQPQQPHSPWVSGLRVALDNALNAGLERLRFARGGHDGRRGSTGSAS